MVTCPKEGDTSSKGLLIPHNVVVIEYVTKKWRNPLWEGPASHQLVGKVMAYQGNDG